MKFRELRRIVAVQHKRTVLVIDDDQDIREVVSLILSFSGFNVTTANDGRSGVDMFISMKPDVVIVDINLPVIDGYQVIDIIRPLVKNDTIILVWSTTPIKRIDGVKILGKPFSIDELLEKITRDDTIHPFTTDDEGRDGLQAK